MARVIALVDGEHTTKAVQWALDAIREKGEEVVGVVFCGGGEKVDLDALDEAYGVPVVRGEDLASVLDDALESWSGECVVDLTDHPILDGDDRFRLANVALARGAPYTGADFELRPPELTTVLTKPSISVFATGKRTGKTAVAAALARHLADAGRRPAIVAVGRGGPDPPRVIEAGTKLDPPALLEMIEAGFHAASDYVEDAITSGVTTIGCVRVGGGMAGGIYHSNVVEGARMAEERDEDLVILEGSGASIPNVAAGAGLLVVPAGLEAKELSAYLGPYRLLLADLCVVTMADEADAAAATQAAIQGAVPRLEVVHVVFRPTPLSPVDGRRVFFCTTSDAGMAARMKKHLEKEHGCEVVGMTHRLSDRKELMRELGDAPDYDVLLTEVKAQAVDVAARRALEQGKQAVFVDNVPMGKGLDEAFDRLVELADERASG